MLEKQLNENNIVSKYGKIAVSVETDSKSINAILGMDILSRLVIRFNTPNADDVSELKQKIIDRLKNQNGRTLDQKITAEKGKTINPDNETKALMQLALSNGFIQASGEENGIRVNKNSSEMPIQDQLEYDDPKTIKKLLLSHSISRLSFFISRQKSDEDFK